MIDLSNLNAVLAGLGPWGVLIGVGLTIGVNWLRARRNPQPAPSPDQPQPAPAPSSTPLLDAVLDAIRKRLSKPVPVQSLYVEADIGPDEAIDLLTKFKA